jgi:SAM-dependent methyltransferase
MNHTRLRDKIKKVPGVQAVIDAAVLLEDWWFDRRYHVDTSPALSSQEEQGWPKDKVNFHYLAIRPKCARRAFRDLTLSDVNDYTFVDFGSGKGRALFMAAELGFGHVWGVELRPELHERALTNIKVCSRVDTSAIASINMDASLFEFPDHNLVLFFFNPFGREVMSKVLTNLSRSLQQRVRDVWIVLHDSTCCDLVDELPRFRLQIAQQGHRIYRSVTATPCA